MIIIGRTEAKAIENNFFVGQERRLGDQNRLETDVVPAVNGAFQRIFLKGSLPIVVVGFSLRTPTVHQLSKVGEGKPKLFFTVHFCSSNTFGGQKRT